MVNEIQTHCDIEKAMLHETIKTKIKPEANKATNLDDQSEAFLSIDKAKLITDLVKTKDLEILRTFNGVGGLAEAIQTNLEDGINGKDKGKRLIEFGYNNFKQPPPQLGFWYFLVEGFKDPTKLFQLLVSAISLGFSIKEDGARERWYDHGGSIFAALLVIGLSAVSNYMQIRQFDRLSKISNDVKLDVVRDGRRQTISISDVVVGEVVFLKIGDRIPADGLFIDGHSLVVEESGMASGKSGFVGVDAIENPFLIGGSKVADGYARMLVTSVSGMGSKMGHGGCEYDNQTPLQSRLDELIVLIGKVACVVAVLDLLAIAIRSFSRNTNNGKNGNWTDTIDIPFVARGVLAIVEGLSLALTVTVAYSTSGMMGDRAMARKLSACETMGSATVICTHKTGILTMNLMKVTSFWVGFDHIEDGNSSIDARVLQLYHQGVGLNTTSSVYKSDEYFGSPTEKAILSWAVTNLGTNIQKSKQDFEILHVETFNSEKKWSGVSIGDRNNNTLHLHRKGAAEMILAMCSNYYQKTGVEMSLNHDEKIRFEKIIKGMAASGLRCIAFAHKQIQENEPKHHDEDGSKTLNEEGLTLLGIIGIKDPCRPGVKEAINTCKSAGVEIKMITGDNVFTAKAIATELGILEAGPHVSNNGEVIEGEEFRNYTEEERMEKVDRIRVMARSSPLDKLLMVQCLKKKGHVVGVTGHSTKDAPALKEADIGLSMGIEGTEVAKESSDIVILDDDFGSIVMGLKWGRCLFDNIQKFIQFQLPANVAALVINFISDASGRGVPLTTVQMLWVNLIMVTFGALALAVEKPTKELMQHNPPAGICITNNMWRNILAQSLHQIVVLLTFWFSGRSFFRVDEKVNGMIILNTFVLCQVFNLFNSRKVEEMNVFEGLHKNMKFLGIVGLILVLQIVMVELLKKVANTQKLNVEQWGMCIGFASLSWPIGWSVKLIQVPETPFLSYIRGRWI
ncbi:hypothetical protein OSB04_022980 [Centaurea solstitialis]|uniref:Calcium-transporting ATPase n=1 Tax=Centaurea solstitialis TaxID=347529 RepID=A0AA38SQS8_9ASTR|nr:hypothetical protein OSB04_022980 [Centaurea solstitialis]